MRTRTSFHFTPAQGNVIYIPQQSTPRQPSDIINYDRLLMLLLFVAIPLLWIGSWLFRGVLWLVFFAILGTLSLLWLKRGFTARGRLTMTGVYTVFAIMALTGALRGGMGEPAVGASIRGSTVEPIRLSSTQSPLALPSQSSQLLDQSENSGDNGGASLRSGSGSECEQVLAKFLEYWKAGSVPDMVTLASQSWRAKANFLQNGAEQSLYSQISGKKLDSYELEGEPTGTDNDTSRTISVLAHVLVKEELRVIRYSAIMLQEEGKWLVDPSSLVSGTRVDTSTPAPGVVVEVVKATATPKPTKAPSKNLKLYYNTKGGEYYHSTSDCDKVAKKYRPLKSFTYGNLKKSPYDKLSPCPDCGAPARPD